MTGDGIASSASAARCAARSTAASGSSRATLHAAVRARTRSRHRPIGATAPRRRRAAERRAVLRRDLSDRTATRSSSMPGPSSAPAASTSSSAREKVASREDRKRLTRPASVGPAPPSDCGAPMCSAPRARAAGCRRSARGAGRLAPARPLRPPSRAATRAPRRRARPDRRMCPRRGGWRGSPAHRPARRSSGDTSRRAAPARRAVNEWRSGREAVLPDRSRARRRAPPGPAARWPRRPARGDGPEAGEPLRLQLVRAALIVEQLRGVAPAQLFEDLLPRPHRRRAPVGPARSPRRRPVAAGGAAPHLLREPASCRCRPRRETRRGRRCRLRPRSSTLRSRASSCIRPSRGTRPTRGVGLRAMACHGDVTP